MSGDERRLVIFGGPGSRAVTATYAGAGTRVLGYLNDTMPAGSDVHGLPVLGGFADWPGQPADVQFLAPLHKVKQMPARAALVERLGVPDDRWATLVDPRTAIAPDVHIGFGSHVGAFAHIQPGSRLGRHVGVRGSVFIGHDCNIGDHVFLGAQAFCGGYARIGEGAHIGPCASIRENIAVGRFAVIGMGAVVVVDVPEYTIVAGNPARPIGEIAPLAGTEQSEV